MENMDRKKLIYGSLLIVLGGILAYSLALSDAREKDSRREPGLARGEEYVLYKSSEYSPEFAYPKYWGAVTVEKGKAVCPEEDTYRTPDTLHIYDWEFAFPERKLPGSDSFVRTGIRLRRLDPGQPDDCGGDFLLSLARKEIIPESLSSFRLNSVEIPSGLTGVYNPEASRLNTEARTQYIFFIPSGEVIYALQPYLSFIPYFGSPELVELEQEFKGDMEKYLAAGDTAGSIRKYREEFHVMTGSLRFGTEY